MHDWFSRIEAESEEIKCIALLCDDDARITAMVINFILLSMGAECLTKILSLKCMAKWV